ncbi:MAG: fibronectin type III domain-containing protein, partial [Elusimicrobiota bacterium]
PPPGGTPGAPASGAIVSVTVSSVTATWTVSSGATDYMFVVSPKPANPPSPVSGSSTTASILGTVSGLVPNGTYYAFVSACNAYGCSAYTAIGSTMTLAAPAVNLTTAAVFAGTADLAWSSDGNAPGTAYQILRSLDGASYAEVASSTIPAVGVTGLTAHVTYYFEVVAVNGAGIPAAPSNVLVVVMPPGPFPSTPAGLAASGGLLNAVVSWSALPAGQQAGGLKEYRLLRSTSPLFGFVQVATTAAAYYDDEPLTAGVTQYYEVVARNLAGDESAPSAPVSALPFTKLPLNPIGIGVAPSSETVTFTWSPTTRFFDGTPFVTTGTPNGDELKGYSVFRSTDLCNPYFTQVATPSSASTAWTDFTNGLNYYYRLYSFNSVGYSSSPVTVSSLGEFNYFLPDCVSRMVLDSQTSALLSGAANGIGDLSISPTSRPQDLGNGVFQSAQWTVLLNGVTPMPHYVLPKPGRFVLGFSETNGVPVPSVSHVNGMAPQALEPGPAASVEDLGMYWFNGLQYVKMYGTVDPVGQTVTVNTPNLGIYQIRAQARSSNGPVFDVSNLSSRVITPNGDGLNDTLIFTYDPGPENVTPVGKIFDVRGAYVADMAPGLVPNTLTWNGYMNGLPVHSGVYVYRITGGGKTFTGSIVVAR